MSYPLVTRSPQVLVSQQLTTTSDTTVYTCPTRSAVEIAKGSISNVSGSAVTFGLGILKAGQSAGDSTHRIIPNTFSLAAGDWKDLTELDGHVLGPGDFISVKAGTANAIDIIISGVVES